MYRRLSLEAKIDLVKRVGAGESIIKVSLEAGISRTILYRWLKKYVQAAPRAKKLVLASKIASGNKHWKRTPTATERKILKIALKNPNFSPAKIGETAGVSPHGVWNFLKRRGLNTQRARENYIAVYGSSLIRPRPASDKLTMIRRFEAGEKISGLCREFGVSRAVFYRWLNRYREVSEEKQREALENRRPRDERHWRFVPEARELILGEVIKDPALSPAKISKAVEVSTGKRILGSHGVYNLLLREGLNTIDQRQKYAQRYEQAPKVPVAPLYEPQIPLFRLRQLLAPFVTVPKLVITKPSVGLLILLLCLLPFLIISFWIRMVLSVPTPSILGLIFASIALTFGIFFFIYSLKYYLSVLLTLRLSQSIGGEQSQKGRVNPLLINLEKVELKKQPFVSIHVAVYNEKKVIERLIQACTSQEWPNYEVVIVDDSTDETTELALQVLRGNQGELRESRGDQGEQIYKFTPITPDQSFDSAQGKPSFTLIHRASREGFKGGALQTALEHTDLRAEYVVVFDSDFVPYPDTIEQFVKTFQVLTTNDQRLTTKANANEAALDVSPLALSNPIAAVQGYQWHVLNKSENWITRGVRTEYAGSYVIERASEEIYGGLKQIAGSVYAIRADILRQFGWGTSITEDFELTLRLYEAGYKVAFTPYIQAPAEAVSTVRRLIRQRMRWAEGASFNVKIMLSRLLFGHWESAESAKKPSSSIASLLHGSIVGEQTQKQFNNVNNETIEQLRKGKVWVPSRLSLTEKLEFIYLAPYYLQAAFFVIGTMSWFISETVFHTRLPFWTATLGWSLVFSNLLSLPMMNITGLFLEESEERDYLGILSFMALSYIVVPFQAYAAIKGFLEKQEGPWFRTPKTGMITDVFQKSTLYRWMGRLWPFGGTQGKPFGKPVAVSVHSLALATVNQQFNSFYSSKKRKIGPLINGLILGFFLFSLTLGYLSPFIPERKESGTQDDVGALNILKPGQAEAVGDKTKRGDEDIAQQTQQLQPQLNQDLGWGVLAMNFDQSIYLPNQEVKISFSVLDEKGLADCDAFLELELKDPQGVRTILSSQDQKIQKSKNCGTLETTNEPDYFATYSSSTVGAYEAEFTATRLGKSRVIVDYFYVEKKPEVVIKRTGPTRLYPQNRYEMEFEISSSEDYIGSIKEVVPLSFDLIHRDGMEISQENGVKTISWQKHLIKGVNYKFSYEFQGPAESPQFYLLGPLRLVANAPRSGQAPEDVVFEEKRAWQLANDAQYNCTWNTGSGTWERAENWSNCNSTYPNNGGGNTYTATIDNSSAVVTTGATAVTIDSLTVGGTNTSSLTLSFSLTVAGDVTINSNGTISAGTTNLTVGGSWSNSGTFTAVYSLVTFNTTSTGKTISGNLTGTSAFYQVQFDGSSSCTRTSAACWTIQDAMEVTGTAGTVLDLRKGHLTLGNGNGDNLEVDGSFRVATAANQAAAFDTITTLAEGSSITIDINDAAAPDCASNCIVTVGASSGTGQGDFKIGKNVTLKFNSSGSVTSGMTVDSTGYLEIQGAENNYATVTAQATYHGYIYLKTGSETIIRYADISQLGASGGSKWGIYVSSVNGFNASEGLTIEYSKIHNGYYGIYASSLTNNNSTNSKGISHNDIYSNSIHGIYFSSSDNNLISYNNIYDNQYNIWLEGSAKNVLAYNTVYSTTLYCNITLSGSGSKNNIVQANTVYQSGTGGYGLDITSSASKNIVFSNTFHNNYNSEIHLDGNDNILYNNDAYSSTWNAVYSVVSTGNMGIAEDYGVLGANSQGDVKFAGASNFRCYSCNLASTTEVSGVTSAGAYFTSFKHDSTGGSTEIWGEYTIPDNNTETPNDEGTNKFNYADNLWEDSFTPHGYVGTGTDDSSLDFAFSGGSLGGSNAAYVYRIVCKNSNCVTSPTNAWDVFRDEVDTGDATTGSTYTDSTTNVQFKIDDAGTDYAQGDTYTFVVWRNSSGTTTQKTLTMMQDGDSFTAGTGETLEFKGQGSGSNLTQVSRGATGGYNFSISGTINAQYYSFNYLGGTGGANGLALNSGATVTSIDDGTFDNFSSTGGASDAFITVDTSLISTGTPSKTISRLSLTNTGSGADYNVKASGSSVSGYWFFADCTSAFCGESYDYDVAPGDEIVWGAGAGTGVQVATSTNSLATAYSWQRKTFYESTNNIYWTFFYTGSAIAYYYSNNDGVSWTSGGTIKTSTNDFSLWYAGGTTVYIALYVNYDIYVNKGTTSSSSISWGTLAIALNGSGTSDIYSYPFMSRDSAGKLWVVARYYNGTNYYMKAVRSTNADVQSTWDSSGIGQPTDLSSTSNTDANVYGVIVPLSSQDMYAVWTRATAIEGKFFDDPTNGWDSSATSIATGTSGVTNNLSAVSDSSGNVHLAYINSSDGVSYQERTSSWQTAITLDSNTGDDYPTISLDTDNSDLYALWIRSNIIYYKKGVSPYGSGNWDSSAASWKTGTSTAYVSSNYSGPGRIFATWTEGSSSPYSVMWGDIIIVPERLLALLGPGFLFPLFLRRKRKGNG